MEQPKTRKLSDNLLVLEIRQIHWMLFSTVNGEQIKDEDNAKKHRKAVSKLVENLQKM